MKEKIVVKLTKKQQEALNKMQRKVWYTAYDLNTSLSTLNALKNKGVIESTYTSGYFYSPRTCILFRVF